MPKPLLVIILGLPAAGKTTLGHWLARELSLPFFYRDGLKEVLFESWGWEDRAWAKKFGQASYELLGYIVERQLAAGASLIIESNFEAHWATARFQTLRAMYVFEPLQIHCYAKGELLLQRYKARVDAGERHPGYFDHLNYHETGANLLTAKSETLAIGGQVLEVNTNDFQQIDYVGILQTARSMLANL